jgi:hypothetical protein
MSADGDELDARVNVWTQEQLGASHAWSKDWYTIVAILEPGGSS